MSEFLFVLTPWREIRYPDEMKANEPNISRRLPAAIRKEISSDATDDPVEIAPELFPS
jgi:hypothetical protein